MKRITRTTIEPHVSNGGFTATIYMTGDYKDSILAETEREAQQWITAQLEYERDQLLTFLAKNSDVASINNNREFQGAK